MSVRQLTPYDPLQTYLTTELNALANNGNKLGAAIDFAAAGTDRKERVDGEIYLASVDLSAQASPALYVWVLQRTNGVDFEDGGDVVTPARQPDDIVPLRADNGAQRVKFTVFANPDQGRILIGNRAGAPFALTGNTVKYNIYSDQFV